MADKTLNSEQRVVTNHINGLSALSANFMSARGSERSFAPQVGANWWQVQFSSPLALQLFVAGLYKDGFSGEISARHTQLEIQATQSSCVEQVQKHVESPTPLVLAAIDCTLIEVVNDAHALFNNQSMNGALVSAGDELCWLQFTSEQSGWLLLDALSNKFAAGQVVHFDPKGQLVIRGGEHARVDLIKWLKPFCK